MNETRYLLIEMTPPSTEIWESDTSFGSLLWLHLCKYKKLAFCVHRQQLLKKKPSKKNKQIKRDSFHSSCVFGHSTFPLLDNKAC
jgi:hypothetical protein